MLLTEMAARVLTTTLRKRMRKATTLSGAKERIVDYCNGFLKECTNVTSFKKKITNQFPNSLDGDEFDRCDFRFIADLRQCFNRLECYTGIQFHKDAICGLNRDPQTFYFLPGDILSFKGRVKTTNMVPFAEAVTYSVAMWSESDVVRRNRLFQQAEAHFSAALRASPWDYRTAVGFANLLYINAMRFVEDEVEKKKLLSRSLELFNTAENIKPCPFSRRGMASVQEALDRLDRGREAQFTSVCDVGNRDVLLGIEIRLRRFITEEDKASPEYATLLAERDRITQKLQKGNFITDPNYEEEKQ